MLLSSSHWFRVTGSRTFQLLMLMMVVALFAVQSSMAHPSSTSTFRPSIHEYQEKQANRSALTHSGSLANSSQLNVAPFLKLAFSSGDDSNLGGDDSCGYRCLYDFVCVNGTCYCPVGYNSLPGLVGNFCSSAICHQDKSCNRWNNTECKYSKCVCLEGYEPHPELSGCVVAPPTTIPSTLPTTPSSTTPACNDNKCGQHSVPDPKWDCACRCEVGYSRNNSFPIMHFCTQYYCTVKDGQRDNCFWHDSYCNASDQLCVCKSGFEQRMSDRSDVECLPIPGWTTMSTTSSATSSTAPTSSSTPSTTSTTELPSTTSTTSSWFSKNTFLIVGILMFVLVVALTLLYIFGCHCCRTEPKIGDTSGANYSRQAYQPSPANLKATSNANSKASSKATSKAASKITSKINSAKTTSKH